MIVFIGVFRKKEVHIGKLWMKYIVYLLLIWGVFFSIELEVFEYLAAVIACAGACELIYSRKSGGNKTGMLFLFISLAVYSVIAAAFLFFAVQNQSTLIVIYTGVVVFDGFSQLFGQLFGKHKITPVISPGKTMEGLVGGIIATAAAVYWIYGNDWVLFVLMTAVTVTGSFTGDLLASWYKRKNGVKDFSEVIPTHGGILDRYDSFIFSGALMALALFAGL
ncbi:MAG: hypothetical protein Fur0041_10710 [Bacteroidia bacterium]